MKLYVYVTGSNLIVYQCRNYESYFSTFVNQLLKAYKESARKVYHPLEFLTGFYEDGTFLFVFFETVAVAFDVDDMAMVQEAVQDGCGNDRVAEDFFPFAEGFVGCHDN
jgi:hypothetical protein